jgi:5-hydroxyisourate hydrolase-like protein (transthyretin family)
MYRWKPSLQHRFEYVKIILTAFSEATNIYQLFYDSTRVRFDIHNIHYQVPIHILWLSYTCTYKGTYKPSKNQNT